LDFQLPALCKGSIVSTNALQINTPDVTAVAAVAAAAAGANWLTDILWPQAWAHQPQRSTRKGQGGIDNGPPGHIGFELTSSLQPTSTPACVLEIQSSRQHWTQQGLQHPLHHAEINYVLITGDASGLEKCTNHTFYTGLVALSHGHSARRDIVYK
jgi:hypothetical protein